MDDGEPQLRIAICLDREQCIERAGCWLAASAWAAVSHSAWADCARRARSSFQSWSARTAAKIGS
jgi:hypothetical protein